MATHGIRQVVSTDWAQKVARRGGEHVDGETGDTIVGRARRALHDTVVGAGSQPFEQLRIRQVLDAAGREHSERTIGPRASASQ